MHLGTFVYHTKMLIQFTKKHLYNVQIHLHDILYIFVQCTDTFVQHTKYICTMNKIHLYWYNVQNTVV